LDNGPASAKWLSVEEKAVLLERLREEEEGKKREGHNVTRLVDTFRSPAVWLLSAVYFGFVLASYGVGFCLLQIISEVITTNPFEIGLLSMIPWGVGALAMVVIGWHSDLTGERRWHVAVAGLTGAIAFAVSAIPGIPGLLGLMVLTVATAGVMGSISTF